MKPSRRSSIAPFYVMEVMKAAERREAAGEGVLHMEVGQPMTPAPAGVRDAAARALAADRLGYTPATGIPQLKSRIAVHYADRYGVTIDPARVIVTTGASAGFVLSCLAAFDPGDRVGITEPGYAAYRNIIEALGLELIGIRVDADSRYVATVDRLAGAGSLAGLVVASPSNPTGTVMTDAELRAVADHCERRDIRLISDEIYHGISFGEPETTALSLSQSVVTVQSLSKYYSMTGWRIGWMVVPDELVDPVERLAQNLYISPPTLSQLAAVAAFDCTDELDVNVAGYAERRQIVVEGLTRAGITSIAPPDGAFYVWADVSHLTDDTQDLCRRWLVDLGVAVTPGIDFDPVRGHRFVRFSYSESTPDVAEAMRRLVDHLTG